MAALDFTNRAAVLSFVEDQLPAADPTMLEALLDASAANDCGEPPATVYRPFYVLASVHSQAVGEYQSVTSAAGSSVTYRDNKAAVRALLRQQRALDGSLCDIPPGFEATGGGSIRVATVF